jgi:hypothetical protein
VDDFIAAIIVGAIVVAINLGVLYLVVKVIMLAIRY